MSVKHHAQIKAFNDKTRFQYILAGRRGGKTRLVREKILQKLHEAPKNAEIFYIGPTLAQAYELIWSDLDERLFELGWEYDPWISKRMFQFSRGRKLYIIGAEKIRRIRGHKVYHAFLDELAFFGVPLSEVWRAVRPALSDLGGGATLTTTPNGKGTEAYDFYIETLKHEEWNFHHWRTLDNPFISPEEIQKARKELDERSFRQEYEASWESFLGLAYYNFDERLHLKNCHEIDATQTMDLCFDFNVNPTTMLISQGNLPIRFKREYSVGESTIQNITAFCEDFKSHPNKLVRIFGDTNGKNRSANVGKSDYFFIQDILKSYGFDYKYCVPSTNGPIVDRVQYMNSWLKNSLGESRIEIDPSCKQLIRDLSSQELDGRHPSDKNNMGHKADAAGYRIVWEQLMATRQPSRVIQL